MMQTKKDSNKVAFYSQTLGFFSFLSPAGVFAPARVDRSGNPGHNGFFEGLFFWGVVQEVGHQDHRVPTETRPNCEKCVLFPKNSCFLLLF